MKAIALSKTLFKSEVSHVQCFCNHFVMHGVWNKWPQASLYASDPILCPSRHTRHSLLDSSSRSSIVTWTRGKLRIAELLAGGDFPEARAATSGTISRAAAMTSIAALTPFLIRTPRHGRDSVESSNAVAFFIYVWNALQTTSSHSTSTSVMRNQSARSWCSCVRVRLFRLIDHRPAGFWPMRLEMDSCRLVYHIKFLEKK